MRGAGTGHAPYEVGAADGAAEAMAGDTDVVGMLVEAGTTDGSGVTVTRKPTSVGGDAVGSTRRPATRTVSSARTPTSSAKALPPSSTMTEPASPKVGSIAPSGRNRAMRG